MENYDRLVTRINELKRKRKALILCHFYQREEIYDVADHIGDSLGLSRLAAQSEAEVIVFCGVHFMAETAAILCPDKPVLLPVLTAGCPMADMVEPEYVRARRKDLPDAQVVAYVNTSAAVKAESDYCCTSANAVSVINHVPSDQIIFVPDKYLGTYAASHTSKQVDLPPGYCPTHAMILPEHVESVNSRHPEAVVLAHPECRPETLALADFIGSTSGMAKYVAESKAKAFIVATEVGFLAKLKRDHPDCDFYPANEYASCVNMKKITLESVLEALEQLEGRIEVPAEIAARARIPIERMLNIPRDKG